MTDINAYLFNGTTIGPNGVLRDGIDVPEYLYLLSKKFFGYVNTVPDLVYYGEEVPSFQVTTPNGFPNLHQNKLYAQKVPLSNPFVDTNTYLIKPDSMSRVISFSNNGYRYFDQNMNNDTLSSKYISKELPYIAFYSNVLLTGLSIAARKPASLYVEYDTTYVHPLLQNAISKNHDGSYDYKLYQSDGVTPIFVDNGFWLVDTDVGSVNFYDRNTSGLQVSSTNPPRISFFRYEGLFGEANILSGQDF